MTTRSAVLWQATVSGRAAQVVFTCRANTTTLLKSIYYVVGATPSWVQFVLNRPGGASVYIVSTTLDGTTGNTGKWDGWVVLEPGDEIIVAAENPTIASWGSGALLPLPSS